MEVTGAAQIGMFDDRVLGIARTAFELVSDDEGDALVGQCADRDRADRDQLGAFGINILEQPKHAETGPESLFGMRPIGQDGEDEPLGVGPDRPPPAPESIGSPLGVTPMRAGHVIGIRAVPAAAVTALVSSNTQTPMEQLDGPGGGANIDLLPDQAVWNGVEEAVDLEVIIERDAGQEPFRKLIVGIRQRRQNGPLDGLEQLSAADADPAHDVDVDALQRGGDRRVRLGQGEGAYREVLNGSTRSETLSRRGNPSDRNSEISSSLENKQASGWLGRRMP